MEAFPHGQTMDYFIGDNKAGRFPQSHVIDFHNKAAGHERRLATYLCENLRMATDLEVCLVRNSLAPFDLLIETRLTST